MGFGELITIWRRHVVLTATLVIVAFLGFGAGLAWFPQTYQAQGSVVLLASKAESKPTGGNPYLNFSPSLSLTADVLSRMLTAPATAGRLARMGFSDAYTIAPPTYTTTTTGSVLLIGVTGTGRAGVERTLHGVIAQLRTSLAQLQGHVRPRNRITITTLSSSPSATLAASASARPIAMTLVFGLLGALGIPVLIDALLRRRKNARAARLATGSASGVLAEGWGSFGVS